MLFTAQRLTLKFSYRTLVTKKQFYDRLLYPGTYLYKAPVLTISNKDYWGRAKPMPMA